MEEDTNKHTPRRRDAARKRKAPGTMIITDPTTCVSQRQLELIALFASGCDYKSIADAKFISYSAVRQTLERARSNVGADSLAHLCALCQDHGLIVRDGNSFLPVVDFTDCS